MNKFGFIRLVKGEIFLDKDNSFNKFPPKNQSILPDPSVELYANYKRCDVVFIEKDGKATKAMICEVTPQKKRVKVAVTAKERPLLLKSPIFKNQCLKFFGVSLL